MNLGNRITLAAWVKPARQATARPDQKGRDGYDERL